jgi:hypothetical protein
MVFERRTETTNARKLLQFCVLLLPVGLGTAAETSKTEKTRLFPPPTRPTITLEIKVSGG